MPALQNKCFLPAHNQRGAALMLLLLLVSVGALAVFVSGLNQATHQLERDRITNEALARAKEALIGYALSSEASTTETQPRPGNFPCPDNDAPGTVGYGNEDSACALGRIGRLPWKTLGLPELRDGSGEVLWYVVSGNFRRKSVASSFIINSDTKGTLLIYGAAGAALLTPPGSEGVAIVLSPGTIQGGQVRDTSSALCPTTSTVIQANRCAANYLENFNAIVGNAITNGPFYSGVSSANFNDRLLAISTKDFMPAIEKRVATEVSRVLRAYYSTKGYYPYPAAPYDANCLDASLSTNCMSDASLRRGRIPQIALPDDWSGTFDFEDWFLVNQWNRVIYYSVGGKFLKNASGACPADCLTVDVDSDVAALFFMPGSPVGGVTRPYLPSSVLATLSDYLGDAENQDGWDISANDLYATPVTTFPDRDRLFFLK